MPQAPMEIKALLAKCLMMKTLTIMTNFRHIFAIVATMAVLSACQKEVGSTQPETQSSYNVTITTETSDALKTAIGADDKYVNWTEGDGITLFEFVDGSLNGDYSSTNIEITPGTPNTAKFTVAVSGEDPAGSSYKYVAGYPTGKITKSENNFQYTINETQNLTATGGFDPAEDVMVSMPQILEQRIDSDLEVRFHRAGAVGKLTVKGIDAGEKIQSVKITLPDGINVTGKCNVDFDTAQSTPVSGKNTITLESEDGIEAVEGGNSLYFRCLAAVWPEGTTVAFEVVTDKNLYGKSVTLPEDYVFSEGGLTKLGVNNFTTKYDPNDYLSMYNNGIDFTICGEVINKKTYGDAKTLSATSINTAFTTKGIYFVDNSKENRTWSINSEAKSMIAGTVLIGRYKNYPQPVMKQGYATTADRGRFIFNDGVMILNYRIEGKDDAYGIFQGRSGVDNSGQDTFRFQDCTFINPNNYLTTFNQGTYSVPKAIYFDNCIIRVKGTVINGGGSGKDFANKPEALETLSLRQTVIAPYSDGETVSPTKGNGCLFNFGSQYIQPTPALNVVMNYCTIFDYEPSSKSRGLIEVKDYDSISIDYTVFYHSSYPAFDNNDKYYTLYASAKCTDGKGVINTLAVYANTISGETFRHGTGNKSNLSNDNKREPYKNSITEATQTAIVNNVNAAKDYFPVQVIKTNGDTALGGASYENKPWVLNSL